MNRTMYCHPGNTSVLLYRYMICRLETEYDLIWKRGRNTFSISLYKSFDNEYYFKPKLKERTWYIPLDILNMKEEIKTTVAIVDDNRLIVEVVDNVLTGFGYDVLLRANSGEEILELIKNGNVIPEICVLDINMPDLGGFQTAVLIRERYPQMKILAFSNQTDPKTVSKMLESGANGFVSKISGIFELRNAVDALVKGGTYLGTGVKTVDG
ncbi:response regulator [Sphingobacterium suaedae]|uniref:Response regulator transcription factor n=1 Tax=Sphingobacterium suaedae TaxID=1686402 RepID=A0ABW5KPK2_9SPHI